MVDLDVRQGGLARPQRVDQGHRFVDVDILVVVRDMHQ